MVIVTFQIMYVIKYYFHINPKHFKQKKFFSPIIRLFTNLFITIKWNNKQVIIKA